jgi:Ribonuclease G/E
MQRAWTKVSAIVKGYLTRRLLRTDKVQNLIREIKDTALVAHSLGDSPEDAALRTHLVNQVNLIVLCPQTTDTNVFQKGKERSELV